MSFSLPTFNLSVNLWRTPTVVTDPPTSTFMANLAYGKRHAMQHETDESAFSTIIMMLLCPPATDIWQDGDIGTISDVVEVPAGSGRFYAVTSVDDAGKGFPNEHRNATLVQFASVIAGITGNPWMVPNWPGPPLP